jgi:hypothetical protein
MDDLDVQALRAQGKPVVENPNRVVIGPLSPVTREAWKGDAGKMGNLDDLRDVTSATLACRRFYEAYIEFPSIKTSVFRRQITPALVPHAVALVEASRLTLQLELSPPETGRHQGERHLSEPAGPRSGRDVVRPGPVRQSGLRPSG